MSKDQEKLCDCAVCTKPVMRVPYQALDVRTCGPICASILAHREHPELEPPRMRHSRMTARS